MAMSKERLDRLKAKLEQLKNPRGNFNSHLWKPSKDKESTIRLISYPYSDDEFVELWFHYGIGKGPAILCPRMNDGKPCSICDFAKSVGKEGSKGLWPKQRIFAVCIDREDSPPVPKFWGFSPTLYTELVEKLLDAEYGNYLDIDKGIDLRVTVTKKSFERNGDKKMVTMEVPSFIFKRNDSKLAQTDKEVKEIMSAIVKIEEVFKPSTNSEIEKRLADWLKVDEEEVEDLSGESTRGDVDESKDENVLEENNVESVEAELEKALED